MRARSWLWLLMVSHGLVSIKAQAQCSLVRADFLRFRLNTALTPVQGSQYALALRKRWQDCRLPADSSLVRLTIISGDYLRKQANYKAAIQNYQQAIQLAAPNAPSQKLIPQAHYLLGTAYLFDNNPAQAKVAFLKALDYSVRHMDTRKWGVLSYVNLAYLSYSQGDYQQALSYVETGIDITRKQPDETLLAPLLREKTNALYALGRYTEGAATAHEMIRVAQQAHITNLGQYYLILGDLESRLNQPAAAIRAYQIAASHYRSANDSSQEAFVLTNLGFLFYMQKEYKQATKQYQQALAIQKNQYSRARLFDNLAACWWQTGEFDKALQTYQQGLLAIPIGFAQREVTQNPAPQSIRNALRKEVLLTLIQDKADTWLDYAKSTNNKYRLRQALATYEVADQMIDFMRWDHTGQQSKLYWRQRTRSIYERAIETCYLLNDAKQAFHFLEKSRAVLLADKLNELGARQQLSPQLAAQEQRLREAVTNQQNKLAELSPDSSQYAQVQAEFLARQDKLDTFLKELESSNPTYYRYKYDNQTVSFTDLQQSLKQQESSFVTYFVGDSSLYVMGITASKAILQKYTVGDYKQALRPFAQLLGNPDQLSKRTNFNTFLSVSNQLYRLLLAPLALPEGRVAVAPDGFFIPFDALSRSTTQPAYALNDYAFSYAYSATLLLKNKPAQNRLFSSRPIDFMGVAPVEFSPASGQVMLSGSDVALRSIANRFTSPTLLTHTAATRQAFQRDVANHSIILLFTHANADSTDQEPILYFADSTLQLSELGDGALPNAQLVALAACKTGIGTYQIGEGVFSLARGFSALGVPSILTTLWNVQNQATYQLTDFFYQYLDQGLPKDIALQRAKQDWLKKADGANQLPNYWAGLIIVGNTEPLARMNTTFWGLTLLIVIITGAGGWWLIKRKRPALKS